MTAGILKYTYSGQGNKGNSMEDERKSKPVVMFGGVYAKAKQRVLNRLGRRTTLTRNPRVDFISGR